MKDVTCRGIEVYGYNIQGWQESIAADFYGYDVFSQTINYQIPFMETSKPRYDGMISEVRHRHLNKDIQTVNYKYDGLRRLVDSEHFVNWDSTACNLWTESSIVYDLNGNIENLSRKRESDDEDIIAVTHSGNRMTGSRINGGTTNTYSYYSDGNLKQDNWRNLQFVYNLLNLPSVVTDASGQTVKARYSYLADGTKLSVRDAQNDGLSYRGSFVYLADGTSSSTAVTEKLESIAHDEGRFVALSASAGATTTQFIDTWHVRDHLGSVRTVLDITRDTSEVSDPTLAILEQNDYLPFGTRIDLDSLAYDQSNRYRYNGKEEQATFGTPYSDYGARQYSSAIGRWLAVDPLAEKYYSISPYAFCNNNPVNLVDPDGRFPDVLWDIASIGMGVRSFVQNIKSGNVSGAVGDAVGIAIDAVAAAVPFVPGGVGAVRAGAKAVNAIDNATDVTKAARTADGINNVANSSDAVSATARGRMNEERVLNDFGLTKNTKTVQGTTRTGEARNTIPDAIISDTVYEVKDVQTLSNTKQIQSQIDYAPKNGLDYKIITGTNTHVSRNIPDEYIIRLEYIGPQK